MLTTDHMPDEIAHSDYIQTGEAARILCVSPETVRRWVSLGHLFSIQTAIGLRLYKRADVEALAQQRAQEK